MLNNQSVTIIMPIRNENNFIEESLNAIITQSYDSDKIEIIIADGLSDDGTVETLKKYKNKFNNIKIIKNIEKIVPTGFNRALSLATGEVIIRIDGHCIIDKNFIKNTIKVLNEKKCVCVGGSIENVSSGIIANSINIAQSSKFGVGGVAFREQNKTGKYVDTLAFGAYKKYIFKKIGGYDQELIRNQDDEFNFRLIQNGEKIWLDPSIKSKYFSRNTYIKLFLQYYFYGTFKVRVIQKRRSFSSFRHLVPSIFVLLLSASWIMFNYNFFPQLFTLLSATYILFGFIFSIIDFSRSKILKSYFNFFIMPFTVMISYMILHVSYGIGFIWGLIKFSGKWNDNMIYDDLFKSDF